MVAKAARIKAWAPEKLICLRLGSGITVLYSLTLYLGIKSPCGVHTPVQATVWQMAKNCLALRSNVEVQVTLSTAFANTRWPQNGQWRMAALKQLQDSRGCWETLKKAWDIFLLQHTSGTEFTVADTDESTKTAHWSWSMLQRQARSNNRICRSTNLVIVFFNVIDAIGSTGFRRIALQSLQRKKRWMRIHAKHGMTFKPCTFFTKWPPHHEWEITHACIWQQHSPVAGTDKCAIPSVQSFFAVSIPPRCAL